MKTTNKYIAVFFFLSAVLTWSCTEEDASLAAPTIPGVVDMGISIAPDSTGAVTFAPTASDAFNFHLYPGDGAGPILIAPGESYDYAYEGLDNVEFAASIVAYGVGAGSSSASELIEMFLKLQIAPETMVALTGAEVNSSKRWVWDSNAEGLSNGHLGVGPGPNLGGQGEGDYFVPSFFSSAANAQPACLYDDVLTFSVGADGNPSFNLFTNGEILVNEREILSLIPGGDTSAASCNAADDLLVLDTSWAVRPVEDGNDLLSLGGGMLTPMSYYMAASEYEVLELTPNKLRIRGFTPDGVLAWYFQFVPE